ncbi:MAG TPA: glycosyltransferase family 2 protein [Alphaproteobacteria bacterium]|nr:glycosyltransferase family 2 protein [Alphaproteobacteria bacterium]
MTSALVNGRITIGICCYNAAETIERSVRSALAQTWSDLEVLVADDASTDNSAAMVALLAQSNPRIRLIRRTTNGGPAATRNTIVANATGEFLAFQDDDDESDPARLKAQVERILDYEARSGDRNVVCFASRKVLHRDGTVTYARSMGVSDTPRGEGIALHVLCGDPLPGAGRIGAGTMMARTDLFRNMPFDENFRRAEEQDWLIRFAVGGGAVVGCSDPLLTQHLTTGADKTSKASLEAALALCRKHRKLLKQHRAYWAALAHAQVRLADPWRRRIALASLAVLRSNVFAAIVRARAASRRGATRPA